MGQVDVAITDLASQCREDLSGAYIVSLDSFRAVMSYHLASDLRLSWSSIGAALGVTPCRARKLARGFARSHHSPDPGQSPAEFAAWRSRVCALPGAARAELPA